MLRYGQFCPVAKTAEVFCDRWSPVIVRELCSGTKTFSDLLKAMPLISRTVLTQRLRELASAGVVQADPKLKGRGHLYGLTSAGEDFRPLIMLMSEWGQRWGQESIGRDDLDPQMLMWALRRQIDPTDIPPPGFVIGFQFRGLPEAHRKLRYWWLLMRPDDIEICLKDHGLEIDVVIDADLGTFTKVWLGYVGVVEASKDGRIAFAGPKRSVAVARRLLKLSDKPLPKRFEFSASV
jgi:DNA-binding HxlR family transcriptional regulator